MRIRPGLAACPFFQFPEMNAVGGEANGHITAPGGIIHLGHQLIAPVRIRLFLIQKNAGSMDIGKMCIRDSFIR